MNKILMAMTMLFALGAVDAVVNAQTVRTKTFDREMMHLRFSTFAEQPVTGWLFLGDVKGDHSRIELLLEEKNPNTGEIGAHIYDCEITAPQESTPRDFNIVQVGPFAQQGAAAVTQGSREFMLSFCDFGLTPNTLTVDCPFQGLPIGTAPRHVTIRQTGTYRASGNQQQTTYDISGHRDVVVCEVVIDGVSYEADGFLTRLADKRVGNPSSDEFYRDPVGWLNLGDVRDQNRQ
jgi:hypothetical protein